MRHATEMKKMLIQDLMSIKTCIEQIHDEAWEIMQIEAKKQHRSDTELGLYKKLVNIYTLSRDIVSNH